MKKFMKKWDMTISVLVILVLCLSFNSLAKADTNTYVFVPVDNIIQLEEIKHIGTYVEWNCLKCVEDIINEFHKYGNDAATIAYKQYLRAKIVIPVIPGFYTVEFVKEYKGFWIFKLGLYIGR